MTEIQSLQALANEFNLMLREYRPQHKKTDVKKYFLAKGNETISPIMDFEQAHFYLLGMTQFLKSQKIVNVLRHHSKLSVNQTVIIPNNCEKYGFVEGEHKLDTLLHFLADMLE